MQKSSFAKRFYKIPLQTVILIPFVFLAVVAVSLVGYISYRNGQEAVNDVSFQLRREINSRIEEHLESFLSIPHRINQANAAAISRGTLDVTDREMLERHFWEQINVIDTITSINFSNTDGGLANAGREGAGGEQYVIYTDDFEKGVFRKYATDDQGNKTELLETIDDFDGRMRSWYSEAVEKGSETWSSAYILFTGQDMVLSASRPVYNRDNELVGVIAANIFLSHLGDFLAGLEVGQSGQSFIMERSGLLIATSTGEKPFVANDGITPRYRVYSGISSDPLTRGAAGALVSRFDDYGAISEAGQFEFAVDGQRMLGLVAPFSDAYGLDWLIVTIIPESDFMAQISANNRSTLYLVIITLSVIILVSILIARRLTGSIEQLNISANELAEGRWEKSDAPGSRIKEISVLTDTFNSMAGQMQDMVTGLNHEINERRAAEEKLAALNTQLQAKNRELEQMINIASHDLRAPLVNIDGYGREIETSLAELNQLFSKIGNGENENLINAALLPALEITSALRYVRSSARQMDVLLKGLLKLSHTGRGPLEIEQLDMNELVAGVVSSFEYQVKEAEVVVKVTGLPPCLGDAVQVRQAFSNIIMNAIKFLDPVRTGVISITGFIEEESAIYCVADNGIGIDSGNHEKIFEIFEQLEAAKYGGEGLGLTIVRQVTGRLGGEVWVESEPGLGSRFYLALPAAISVDS